jgi:hypothetical protein
LISKKNPSPQLLVLIVEDEVFTRFHAVDLVEAAGYRAILTGIDFQGFDLETK